MFLTYFEILCEIYLVGGRSHSASVEVNIESGAKLTGSRANVNAIGIAVVSLGENHSVEWPIEFNVDAHVSLFALHLQVLDLRLIARLTDGPLIFGSRSNGTTLRWVACKTAAIWWLQQSRSGWDVIGRNWNLSFVVCRSSSQRDWIDIHTAVLQRKDRRVRCLVGVDTL